MTLNRYSTEELEKIFKRLARSNKTMLTNLIVMELLRRSIFKTKIYEKI